MKVILLFSTILVIFALIFPVAAAWNTAPSVPAPEAAPAGDSAGGLFYVPPEKVSSDWDTDTEIDLLVGSEIRRISVRDYLLGAVSAEMPASFEPEALRAQAVALRTYLARKLLHPTSAHPEADICADSSCCAAWRDQAYLRDKWGEGFEANLAKITDAVDGTCGEYLEYSGEPALAVFHSSSSGRTEDAGEVWSVPVPYLVSVDTPESAETVPSYTTAVTVSANEFKETILSAHPEAEFTGEPTEWITDPLLTVSGRISSVLVGGVPVSGAELRSLFGLRSTAISFSATASAVTMTSTGYGHGVGMSQYGAQTMALEGADHREILASYYPGTELVTA